MGNFVIGVIGLRKILTRKSRRRESLGLRETGNDVLNHFLMLRDPDFYSFIELFNNLLIS